MQQANPFRSPHAGWAWGAGLGVAFLSATVWLAFRMREGPLLCPEGYTRSGANCVGRAESPAVRQRVRLKGSSVLLGGPDWEGRGGKAERASVVTFELDATEVSAGRYAECVAARRCDPLPASDPRLPVRNVRPEQAERYCAFAGGRLPTGGEWVLAAAGKEGRRYPWGSTGLVCRRTVFGLESGPCAEGGSSPDAPGSRPDGATPEGVLDLAGNVAEWTREPNGRFLARGGSYLAKGAAELKSWAASERSRAAPDIGFRCAYPSRR